MSIQNPIRLHRMDRMYPVNPYKLGPDLFLMALKNLFENENKQYKLMPAKTDENLICDGVHIHSRHFLLLPCPVQLSRNSRKWRSEGSDIKRTARHISASIPKGHFGTRKRHTLPTNESLLPWLSRVSLMYQVFESRNG